MHELVNLLVVTPLGVKHLRHYLLICEQFQIILPLIFKKFYYSEVDYDDQYISIIKTPTKKDLSDAEIVAKINIPDSLNDIQLFLNGDKLVILGSRYASKSDSIL